MKRAFLILLTLALSFIGCRAPSDSDDAGWKGPVAPGRGSSSIGQYGPPVQSESPDRFWLISNELLFVTGMYCGRLVTPDGVEEDLSYCRAMADEVNHSDGKSPEELSRSVIEITQDFCAQGETEYSQDQRAIAKKMHCDLVRMMQGRAEAGRDQ